MAAIRDIFGSGISGKVGNVVYCQRNGKTYVRSLPVKRTGAVTPKQMKQRKRFAEMIKFSRQFKYELIPQIWNQASNTRAGVQLFVKTNKAAFGLEGQIMDLKQIQLSIGKLSLPFEMTAQRQCIGSPIIDVNWLKDPRLSSVPYWDELMAVSTGEGKYSEIKATGIRRGDNLGTFELPELDVVATHLFLFFSSLDKRNYSESICFEIYEN